MAEEKPTIDWITTLRDGLRDKVYSTMHANMRKCKAAFELEIDVAVPEGFEKYIPPTAFWIVQDGATQIITDRPTVEVEAVADTKKAQENQEITQKFLEHCLWQWTLMNEVSPLQECAKNMCRYGMACLKGPLYDAKLWGRSIEREGESDDDWKERKSAQDLDRIMNFPLFTRGIDPLTIFPDPSGRRGFIIESYKRLAIDIHASWPEWKGYDSKNLLEEIDWLEFWSPYWRCFIAGDEPVLKGEVIKNIYGFIPYDWSYSGWGTSSPDGKPEDKAMGLLNRTLSALQSEARLKTAMDNHLRVNVYQRMRITPGSNVKLDMSPGGVTEAEKEDVDLMPQPQINPDTFGILGSVMQDIRSATYPEALSGGREPGVESGYFQGLKIGQGRLKFKAPTERLQLMAASCLQKHAILLKRLIKQPIPIMGKLTIKHSQIEEPVMAKVKLEPVDPMENDRRIKQGLELLTRNVISLRSMRMDYAKVSDKEEREQILIEAVLAHPTINSVLMQGAAEDWGLKRLIEKIAAEQAMAPTGVPTGVPTGTPMGQVPPPTGMPPGQPPELDRRLQRLGAPGSNEQMLSPAEVREVPLAPR